MGLTGLFTAGASVANNAARIAADAVQQQKNRDLKRELLIKGQTFQEHMASTVFQRSKKDAMDAGYNPAMAMVGTGTAAQLQSSNESESNLSQLYDLASYMSTEKHPNLSPVRPK